MPRRYWAAPGSARRRRGQFALREGGSRLTAIDYLFVYGTLRRDFGHPMHRVIAAGADPAGFAVAPGSLFDLGPYPGLWLRETRGAGVRGEVYRLRPEQATEILDRLDDYEGVRSIEVEGCSYRRVAIEVQQVDASLRAWAYALTGLPDDAVAVPDGDYLAWVVSRRDGGRPPGNESA